MASDETTANDLIEIPEDATVIRQSKWAWGLPGAPWVLFLFASLFIDVISMSLLPIILTAIVVVPRYLRWRKAAYILTEDHVVVMRGGLTGGQRYDLPIAEFADVNSRPGIFGASLGYRAVDITLRNGKVIVLDYVPQSSPLAAHLRSRIDGDDAREEAPPAEEPNEGESGGDDENQGSARA